MIIASNGGNFLVGNINICKCGTHLIFRYIEDVLMMILLYRGMQLCLLIELSSNQTEFHSTQKQYPKTIHTFL